MSLHAQLTHDAARILRQQKRKSTILSLLLSLLTIFLVSLILGFLAVRSFTLDGAPDIITRLPPPQSRTPIEPTTQTSFQRRPTAPSSFANRLLAVHTVQPVAIPVSDTPTPSVSVEFGSGNGFGDGWDGSSGTGNYQPIPFEHRKRCSKEDRLQRLAQNGGNEACEEAVIKSLRWLKANQNSDGSWGSSKPVAMTGLSLLAYLGHCETPESLEFGDAVTAGMLFLINNSLQQNGKLATDLQDKHWCYEHAIAVYALAESYLFCKALGIAPQLKESVTNGTQWILANQTEAGGWDYSYSLTNRPGDSSIVAWHLQALKAADTTGLPFPKLKSSIRKGLKFLEGCQNDNGGFGYGLNKQPVGSAEGHFTLTGAGALCFQQHKGTSNSNARQGIRYLAANAVFDFGNQNANLYEHYYSSQAMMNHGDQAWHNYNALFRDELLENQKDDGSWPHSNGPGNHRDLVYSTSLATLMLEVYYRYLPSAAL